MVTSHLVKDEVNLNFWRAVRQFHPRARDLALDLNMAMTPQAMNEWLPFRIDEQKFIDYDNHIREQQELPQDPKVFWRNYTASDELRAQALDLLMEPPAATCCDSFLSIAQKVVERAPGASKEWRALVTFHRSNGDVANVTNGRLRRGFPAFVEDEDGFAEPPPRRLNPVKSFSQAIGIIGKAKRG